MVKLTALLYELLGLLNGRRDHEQLASELGARIDREVTAEDIRFLIERKLAPLGLVEAGESAPELVKANPLLALRPRFVITQPGLTRTLTQPFTWLFKPPVVATLIIAFTAVAFWLVGNKGLSSALHQAFYEPGLILVVWALVVVSMAFHEIGHASACRYSGARPGVMGGGLYLIWPAFYTEVSDAYRLDRRGRLRVDLGGLYFTAIFAVMSAGLWLATGVDALLLVVAMQLIQMVKQLAPFIRADGYHIVADLVGVPDLFAHIKPTLAGLLPTRWRGGQHQSLKPWARAVVTAWVLITVPLLIGLLVLVVVTLPRLAGTAWDSMDLHWAQAATAWQADDLAGAAVAFISTALVALPIASILFLLWRLSRRAAVFTWRKTADRPKLRGVSLFGAAVLVALVAWAWWPTGENYRPISSEERGTVPTVLRPPVGEAGIGPVSAGRRAPSPRPAPARLVRHPRGSRAVGTVATLPVSLAVEQQIQRRLAPETEVGETTAEEAPLPPGGEAPRNALTGAPLAAPGAEPRSAWPFPFDPPLPMQPGDNRAMAVNTTDGSTQWDFEPSFVTVEGGDPVRQTNDAHAYASCTDCRTGATAFQVLLVVGRSEEIAPVNAAVAANYHCVRCRTYAFAYQIVASVTEVTPEVQEALEAARARLLDLDARADSLTAAEIHAALEEIEQQVLESLDEVIAIDSDSDAAASEPDPAPTP
jgi:putative peptide zinc metalloprotease protein